MNQIDKPTKLEYAGIFGGGPLLEAIRHPPRLLLTLLTFFLSSDSPLVGYMFFWLLWPKQSGRTTVA